MPIYKTGYCSHILFDMADTTTIRVSKRTAAMVRQEATRRGVSQDGMVEIAFAELQRRSAEAAHRQSYVDEPEDEGLVVAATAAMERRRTAGR